MKISSIPKVALALMLMATPAEMCGQSFLKKLGKGLEKVLSTPSSSSQNQKKPAATVQKSTTAAQKPVGDIVIGDMLIRPYGDNPNCDIQFVMARREGEHVNIYFYLVNKNNQPLNNLWMRNYGDDAVKANSLSGAAIQVARLSFGQQSSSEGLSTNIPARGKVQGCISLANVTLGTEHIADIHINLSAAIGANASRNSFGFLLNTMPITEFVLKKGGLGNLDFTKPISQFPKSVRGLYDKFEVETVLNEMEGYEETYVNFTLNGEKVMTGMSDSEGAEKILSSLTAEAPIVFTPKGIYPGMPLKEAFARGATFAREGWMEGLKENNCWIYYEGEMTPAGQQKYQKACDSYERKLNTNPNATFVSNITAGDFKPNAKVFNIQFYF